VLVSGSVAELRSKPSRFFRSTSGSVLQVRPPSRVGLGRIVALYCRSFTLYQIY
jgi:hypothetical protein